MEKVGQQECNTTRIFPIQCNTRPKHWEGRYPILINALSAWKVKQLHICVYSWVSKCLMVPWCFFFSCVLKPICHHSNSILCSFLQVQVVIFSTFWFGNAIIVFGSIGFIVVFHIRSMQILNGSWKFKSSSWL